MNAPAPGRGLSVLSWLVVLSLLALLGVGLFVPLYSDEVATKFVQARYLAEGGQMITLFPQCGAGLARPTPLSWHPAALLFDLMYGHLTPLGLRIAGAALALAWLGVLAAWLSQAVSGARLLAWAAAAATLGLGVLPLTLVLTRPEQWLLLLLAGFLLLPAIAARWLRAGPRWAGPAMCGAFLLMASVFGYSHPKALFFVPVMLASAWYTFGRAHRSMLGLAVAFVMFSGYQGYQFASGATRCEAAPQLQRTLRAQATELSLAVRAPGEFLREMLTNVVNAPRRISEHARFEAVYQSGWLPAADAAPSGALVQRLNVAITVVLYAVCGLALLLPPLALGLAGAAVARGPPAWLLVALWAGQVGHLALLREWNFYTGVLVVGVAVMLVAGCASRLRELPGVPVLARGLLAVLMLLSLASTAQLAYSVAPRLLALAQATDEYLPRQPYSVNAFAFPAVRERLRALAGRCGIEADGARRLVVDDFSYFAFTGLSQPVHLAYLYPGNWGSDVAGRSRGLLRDLGTRAIIGQCSLLSWEFRSEAVRDGNLCCVKLAD